MIAWLKGEVKKIGVGNIILNVNNIGYDLSVTKTVVSLVSVGEEKEFHVYEHIREDSYNLFGFVTEDELVFFKKILSVKGIGPKIALAILSGYTVQALVQAVNNEDLSILTNISGIGMKSAQRIILELKGKISSISTVLKYEETDKDLIEALKGLGYTHPVIQDAIKNIPEKKDLTIRIKQALKYIREF